MKTYTGYEKSGNLHLKLVGSQPAKKRKYKKRKKAVPVKTVTRHCRKKRNYHLNYKALGLTAIAGATLGYVIAINRNEFFNQ